MSCLGGLRTLAVAVPIYHALYSTSGASMRLLLMATLILAACGDTSSDDSGAAGTTSGGDGTGGDSTGDGNGDGGSTEACVAMESGTYSAKGPCFGMQMAVDVSFDTAACSFVLDNWDMNMSGMPEGGTVAGDQVTLSGGDFDDCTGTWEDGDISGTCPDGCAWVLNYAG